MKAAIGKDARRRREIQKAYNDATGIEPEDDQRASRHPHAAEAKACTGPTRKGRRPGGTARPGRARTSSPTSMR